METLCNELPKSHYELEADLSSPRESEEKCIGQVSFKWCAHCGLWNKTHITIEHAIGQKGVPPSVSAAMPLPAAYAATISSISGSETDGAPMALCLNLGPTFI